MDSHALVTTYKKEVNIAILVVPLFVLFALFSAVALAATDTFNVNVNVSTYAEITVLPINFSWTELSPASDGTAYNFTVKNTGSTNLTNVYISSDALSDEATNPLGTGDSYAYAAAGLIMIKNETGASQFYHVGRPEWNLSSLLADEDLDLAAATSNFGHGFYRNASLGDYLWKVENGTDNYCNNTNAVFKILRFPENASQTYRDFTTGTIDTATFKSAGTSWATFTLGAGALNGYCVATHSSCTKIYIYKYDMSGTFPSCSNATYLSTDNLVIGDQLEFKIFPSVPRGMPSGDMTEGTMTITAS